MSKEIYKLARPVTHEGKTIDTFELGDDLTGNLWAEVELDWRRRYGINERDIAAEPALSTSFRTMLVCRLANQLYEVGEKLHVSDTMRLHALLGKLMDL